MLKYHTWGKVFIGPSGFLPQLLIALGAIPSFTVSLTATVLVGHIGKLVWVSIGPSAVKATFASSCLKSKVIPIFYHSHIHFFTLLPIDIHLRGLLFPFFSPYYLRFLSLTLAWRMQGPFGPNRSYLHDSLLIGYYWYHCVKEIRILVNKEIKI